MYVIEFPFIKLQEFILQPTINLKNSLQILFWSCRLFNVLKILENVQEKLCHGVPLSNLQVFRLQLLALSSMFVKFWKIPEITCTMEFSTRDVSIQF